ncbi:AraC family transcriptional regulator [Luteimonas sp. 8-5]|jgi:AraC-like DNA-binding protein|uniref:helix-turn-helix domain-containing protein n=1 Tax=Luteimonas sp. 8-5 TaxID=3039387 RepID=UPI002436AF08|nr:AraC family transcriptional regulator [Luteimonas sp. 8-5]MDG6348544.1 AraC family transcriptional regulator [Luteimonas sp. 8-5]
MRYVEHSPPQDLRRHVECLWELRDEDPADAVQVVYPDGRCELLAELATPLRFQGPDGEVRADEALAFAAQQRGPIRLQATGPVHCFGLRLAAAASSLVAGTRLPALRDSAPDMRLLDPAFAGDFESAARASAATDSPEPLWQVMRGRCAAFVPDAIVEAAVTLIDDNAGDVRIGALAAQLGVPLRNLQARFLAEVGMSPKEYARVRRLRALLRTLDEGPATIADAAARHGYADQAHATHDLARWTGTTPARLVRALHADRDGDGTLRLAAAFIRGAA